MRRPQYVLPAIVVAQFAGTSLWFAGNAITEDLQRDLGLHAGAVSQLTSSVQFGFISGTLVFALLAVADRMSPRLLFLGCCLTGALLNAGSAVLASSQLELLTLRFATGFFLAGIYPVGMKIAASWYERGLGRALGYLVGALVVGTAFPHLVRGFGEALSWRAMLLGISGLAAAGGITLYALVPNGPHLKHAAPFDPAVIARIFHKADFRSAAFGYFGHMWELYAFWAFIPWLLVEHQTMHGGIGPSASVLSFLVIAAGAVGCIGGGLFSSRYGSAHVAFWQLAISGVCCALSPWLLQVPASVFIVVLVLWGVTVVGDSPQFSALAAQTAPKEYVGSALTLVNCIGFSITIGSIELLGWLTRTELRHYAFVFLLPGPVFGLFSLKRLLTSPS